MSTSLLTYKKKSFWIHNAVAEVWVSYFLRAIRSGSHPYWLHGMVDEIEPALEAGWVEGVIANAFDSHIKSKDQLEQFVPIMKLVNEKILQQTNISPIVSIDKFDASSAFLAPEILMIETLFLRPEQILEPWKVFTLNEGWRVA